MALQFSLAQAQRQRLREQHHIWIREKLKHLETLEEVAEEQNKGLVPEDQVRRGKGGQALCRGKDPTSITTNGLAFFLMVFTALRVIDETTLMPRSRMGVQVACGYKEADLTQAGVGQRTGHLS